MKVAMSTPPAFFRSQARKALSWVAWTTPLRSQYPRRVWPVFALDFFAIVGYLTTSYLTGLVVISLARALARSRAYLGSVLLRKVAMSMPPSCSFSHALKIAVRSGTGTPFGVQYSRRTATSSLLGSGDGRFSTPVSGSEVLRVAGVAPPVVAAGLEITCVAVPELVL